MRKAFTRFDEELDVSRLHTLRRQDETKMNFFIDIKPKKY